MGQGHERRLVHRCGAVLIGAVGHDPVDQGPQTVDVRGTLDGQRGSRVVSTGSADEDGSLGVASLAGSTNR